MEDTSDPPINKLTDIEWNQLKHEFISQYLKDLPSGMDHQLAHDNIIYDNIYMDIHPNVNILHDNMEEKPFIVSIQDRDLHNSHEEVTYNINWNVPENTNMTTTTTHTKDHTNYASSNDKYSGIDLINDSLCGNNNNVDIYDELLKRKENELFGTKHTKNITFNCVATQTYNDPIMNQIDLFHKWIDRHRDIYAKRGTIRKICYIN
ncbi:hypothetical protein PFAG_00789 [Plasmodium falciparum Santa Lucia]|nr:hypothetical protein PFAG_00789 [Plasmodium falciparum Santa Lucia]